MQLGDVIRILRTSQNMTQKQLAMNILDRGNLSKIEHNLLEPSYTNFHLLISKLGISANEFEYIRNNYTWNSKSELMYDFFKLHYNTDQQQINILLSECNNFKEDPEIKRISTILQAMKILGKQHGFERAQKIIAPIWYNYLSQKSIWTITDLQILNMIFFVLDNEAIETIIPQAVRTIETKYPFMQTLKISFLLNKGYLRMKQEKFKSAIMIFKNALTPIKKLNRYDELLLIKGRIEICNKNKAKALAFKNLLISIEADNTANALNSEIQEFDYLFN